MAGAIRCISSMKSTSRARRFVRMAARSPGFSRTGPAVDFTGTRSSLAITIASVVLPRPGGPYSSTWSSASPRCVAAATATDRFSRTRSCPMYSSSVRGRSPASYCASSSTREAVTRRSSDMFLDPGTSSPDPLCTRERLQHGPQQLLERFLGHVRERSIERFLDGRALIPEVDQRRQQVAPPIVFRGRRRPALCFRQLRQAVLQLEPDAFRRLLADARNLRQACDVLSTDRANQLRR